MLEKAFKSKLRVLAEHPALPLKDIVHLSILMATDEGDLVLDPFMGLKRLGASLMRLIGFSGICLATILW